MAKFANVFGEGKREVKPGLKFSSGVATAQRLLCRLLKPALHCYTFENASQVGG
jgi:hypothetical protein